MKDRRAKRLLLEQSRAVNFVWNYCVETQKKVQQIWKDGKSKRWPSHYELCFLTGGTSSFLALHSGSIQATCNRFVLSRETNARCPRFRKSFGRKRSLGWVPFKPQSRQLKDNSIKYLGKVIRFFGAKRRPLPDVVKGGCFVEDASGKWYVCLTVEVDPLPPGTGEVGIDLGLKTLATCSDGQKIENPRSYRKLEAKLKSAQRAGKKKLVKRIHAKIKNVRQDYLHKVSAAVANSQLSAVEVLQILSNKITEVQEIQNSLTQDRLDLSK